MNHDAWLVSQARLHLDPLELTHPAFTGHNMTELPALQESIRERIENIRRKAGTTAKNFDATLDKVGARAVEIASKTKREAARRLIAFVNAEEEDEPEEEDN